MTERPSNNDGSEHCPECSFDECILECICYSCVGFGSYYCPITSCAYDPEL